MVLSPLYSVLGSCGVVAVGIVCPSSWGLVMWYLGDVVSLYPGIEEYDATGGLILFKNHPIISIKRKLISPRRGTAVIIKNA